MKRISLLAVLLVLVSACDGRQAETGRPTGPGSVSGVVSVEKPAGLPIYVGIARSLDELTRPVRLTVLPEPGPFQIDNVDPGTYRLGAFVDTNGNQWPDMPREPTFVLPTALTIPPGEHLAGISVQGFFNERDPSFRTPELAEQYESMMAAAGAAVEQAYGTMKEGRSDVLADVVPSLRAMVYEAGETWPYAGNEADWEFITAMLAPIPEMAEAAARGENPLVSRRGCFLRAYVSEYDGSVRSYAVYVPDGYDGSRAFPLIIALHGAGGDHWSGLKMVTGSSALIVGAAESNEHFFPRRLPPDFIIACPGGHGYHGPGYKGPAEYDALKVLKEMMSSYNIDADRVYLTGSSKGGHGTWEIGLKYPELFAAIAPVCGATDAIRSLAGGAGCGLRIYVFHGAKDRVIPVDQSRVMVAMLLASGAQVEYVEYPDLGHEASSLAYRDDAVIEVFRK